MMKILITGANGQLAREFIKHLEKRQYPALAMSREKLDISRMQEVTDALSSCNPDVVLNCAAYNHVDNAEKDPHTAFKINAEGVRNLAIACKKNKALLVHYSTDYVFDGEKETPYTEEDVPNPINAYGKSKLSGERLLSEEMDNFLLFRVSWVFGEGRQNFLYKLSEWAKTNSVLKIACDQVSVPTSTEDIVNATMLAIDKDLRGIYHLANSGYASRYEIARYFMERMGLGNLILPVSSDFFASPAKRPYFSAMSNGRLSEALKLNIPHWKDGIDRFVKRMKEEG